MTANATERDAVAAEVIAPPVARLIALFHGELAHVRFPGMDAAVLDGGAERVRQAAAELARAEAQVATARAALAEAEEQLLRKGERALAYARIYAEEAPAIAAALDGIALGRTAAGRGGDATGTATALAEAPRRRGRPRKVTTDAATLFSAPAGEDAGGPQLVAMSELA